MVGIWILLIADLELERKCHHVYSERPGTKRKLRHTVVRVQRAKSLDEILQIIKS